MPIGSSYLRPIQPTDPWRWKLHVYLSTRWIPIFRDFRHATKMGHWGIIGDTDYHGLGADTSNSAARPFGKRSDKVRRIRLLHPTTAEVLARSFESPVLFVDVTTEPENRLCSH